MRRDENSNIEHAGQDSFLDVTTNIVGVLIILVMVVGMRTKSDCASLEHATYYRRTAIAGQAGGECRIRRAADGTGNCFDRSGSRC